MKVAKCCIIHILHSDFLYAGALAGDAELTEDSHIVMYDVTCDGSEDALTSCAHRLNGPEIDDLSCDNAYVVCQGRYDKIGM